MPLPSGTITFLFTDIEGSTRLWEEKPAAMRGALERHDILLRQAIDANGGAVFKTAGDAFCAAFPSAESGIRAALQAQIELSTGQELKDILSIRVRMALHTGEADERDGDYFGAALNRVDRLLKAGHGGQVLISEVARDLISDTASLRVSFRDLGYHRLKDLREPGRIFQLVHPSLQADFLPIRSLASFAHNLPQQLTSFIGREKEMAEVKRVLSSNRLVTLTGAGGCGKTRLALQVSADMLEEFPDGVWLVDLANVTDASAAPAIAAAALGIREDHGRPASALTEFLRERPSLIILDNCEHILEGCVSLTRSILQNCSAAKLLVTSREPLGIEGEVAWRVPSLRMPDVQFLTPTPARISSDELAELTQCESISLFLDRARLALPTFKMTQQNAASIAQICYRLDGIPLAIELASARVKVLTVEQIAQRLDDRFRLLTGGSRTAIPRHQTLRALIDWSYGMLSEDERRTLCSLSVFAGGFSEDAAEQVCSVDSSKRRRIGEELSRLVDKSMVAVGDDRERRYRLLETVRQYCQEKLLENWDAEAVRTRHADYFVSLGDRAEQEIRGPNQTYWLGRLEAEHDNIRATLRWCLALDGWPLAESGLRLAGSLWQFWAIRNHRKEGLDWLASALRRAVNAPPELQARALLGAGWLEWHLGRSGSARAFGEQSLALYRQLDNSWGVAYSLHQLGSVSEQQCRFEEAGKLYEESLRIRREIADAPGIAWSLCHLGSLELALNHPDESRNYYQQGLDAAREAGDKWAEAHALDQLGLLANQANEFDLARSLWEDSLAIRQEVGDKASIARSLIHLSHLAALTGDQTRAATLKAETLVAAKQARDSWAIAHSLHDLGNVAFESGDLSAALSNFAEALLHFRDLDDHSGISISLAAFERIAVNRNSMDIAARLYGAEQALREASSIPRSPAVESAWEADKPRVLDALGEDGFEAEVAAGRAMSVSDSIELALKAASDTDLSDTGKRRIKS